MKVLVADDDPTTRKSLEFLLSRSGCEVISTSDGVVAYARLTEDNAPRIAILDVRMPRMSGVDVCRKLTQLKWDVPPYLIILTGRDSREEILRGFEAGAVDYLEKPLDSDQLWARIAVAKRTLALQQTLVERIWQLEETLERVSQLLGLFQKDRNTYEFGRFRLEAAEYRLFKDGAVVPLPAKVFDLLLFLVQNNGNLMGKEELIAGVWLGTVVEDNNLTVAMSALRKVLGESTSERYIETIKKRGYRFSANVKIVEESTS